MKLSLSKSDLFQREEALILGYMLSKYFTVSKSPGLNGYTFNLEDIITGSRPPGAHNDGSGNYPAGNAGKPPYVTSNGDLCGGGGTQASGGSGVHNGLFGFGGNGRGYTSSGGGGGFFGGGSSYIKAGGGGGSCYCWLGEPIVEGYMNGVTEYMAEQGIDYNPAFYRGCPFGKYDILGNNDYLNYYRENANFYNGSLSIKQVSVSLLDRTGNLPYFCAKTGFNISGGNGIYTISDDYLGCSDTIDETEIEGNKDFEYKRGYIDYIVPRTGFYLISGYGAQGGGGSSREDPEDDAVGGCGAYAQCCYLLKGGTTLKIEIGQTGGNIKAPVRPQGGGGGAASNGYAGGGATTVFLIEGDEYSRLFVAAGGGGAGAGRGWKDPPVGPSGPDTPTDSPEPGPSDPDDDGSISTGKRMYVISDLSIAHVDITYKCSYDNVEDKTIKVTLYVDGVKRGVVTKPVIAGGGADTWTFDNFDTWLPPNTTPYWATIEAIVETDLEEMIIPAYGLVIRVETKTRPNDATPLLKKIFGFVKDKIFARSFMEFCINVREVKGDLNELKNIRVGALGASSFIDLFIKIVKNLHNTALNKITCQSMMEFTIKKVEQLNIDVLSQVNSGSLFDFSIVGEEEPVVPEMGELEDLQYISTRTGVDTYTAIFIKSIPKINADFLSKLGAQSLMDIQIVKDSAESVGVDILSKLGAQSFMEVRIQEVPKVQIDLLSKINAQSDMDITNKVVPELKIDTISTVKVEDLNDIEGV